jgi:hypothetical protein
MASDETQLITLSATAVCGADRKRATQADCRELIANMQDVTGHAPKMWGRSMVGVDQYH